MAPSAVALLHRRLVRTGVAAATLLLLLAPARRASATAYGSMFSGPTTGDGASVLWNPGAMTLMRGTVAMIYGGLSIIRLQYQRNTPNLFNNTIYPRADLGVFKPDAMFGLVSDFGLDRFRFGIGVNVPVLDGASWDESYGGQPASTRYYALRGRQMHIGIRPAVAFRINKYISVGVGFDVQIVVFSHDAMTDFGARINQIACASSAQNCQIDTPLARENPAYDARTKLAGVGAGVGVSGGVLITPFKWLRIGASVFSGARDVTVGSDVEIDLPQSVTNYVKQNLPSVSLPALTAQADTIGHSPLQIALGLAAYPIPALELAVDFHWSQKSKMSVLYVNVTQTSSALVSDQAAVKAASDDWLLGFRAAYRVLPSLVVGARFEMDPDARPGPFMTPVSIDFDKYQIVIGAQWRATKWLTVSAEYGHYFIISRTITTSRFGPNPNPTNPVEAGFDKPDPGGSYASQTDRFGVQLSFAFR